MKKRYLPRYKDLYPYQREGIEFLSRHPRALLADEMGCISGNAEIQCNRAGKGFRIPLKKLYEQFNGISGKWDLSIETKCRSYLSSGRIGLNTIQSVLDKGVRPVITITAMTGKEITLTPDHEILTPSGWIPAEKLSIGMQILSNGKLICPLCGSSENIITNKYSKFTGVCRRCMYTKCRKNTNIISGRRIGHDGYVYLFGDKYREHPRYSTSGLLEHIFLMEQWTGGAIPPGYEVHHKNENRSDNRKENLVLLTKAEHKKTHCTENHFKNYFRFGNEVINVPIVDTIVDIKNAGTERVYDIIMSDPDRNFIAGKFIVHNCGKTAQAIFSIAERPDTLPALIITPASLKLNWQSEFRSWAGMDTTVISGKAPVSDYGKITIINYDILEAHLPELLKWEYKTVVIEECHYAKNMKAARTKAVRKIGRKVDRVIAISGTPIVNRPSEFFTILNLLAPERFGSFWGFARRYCGARHNGFGWDFSGSSNSEELHKLLTSTVMIRRKKSDVLTDLPEKTRAIVPLLGDSIDEYKEARAELIAALSGEDRDSAIVLINRLKQFAAKSKLPEALSWIRDFIESGEKIVLFGIHHVIIDAVVEAFPGIIVKIDGRDSMTARDEAVRRFQEDPRIRIFIGNIKAAGVGLTLTAASNVAFLELPWSPGDLEQAIDRCHRIGQRNAVTAWFLVARGTIEEDIAGILDSKRIQLDGILDGEETDNSTLIGELLKEYRDEK